MMTDKELKSAMNFILTQGGRVPHPDTRSYKSAKSDRPSSAKTTVKNETYKKFMRGMSEAHERFLAEQRGGKPIQKIDGYPWEPGIYTINFEGAGISAAQTRYNSFLKSMKKRPDFKILHQNFTEFFNGVSIFVTYSI